MFTPDQLFQDAVAKYVDVPGTYLVHVDQWSTITSRAGNPALRVHMRVDEVVFTEAENPDELVGARIDDDIYFTERALNRVLIFMYALGLVRADEREREFPSKKDMVEYFYSVIEERIAEAKANGRKFYVELKVQPGRDQQVFNPDTGQIETVPGEPRLTVPFAGYSPYIDEDVEIEDAGPDEIPWEE